MVVILIQLLHSSSLLKNPLKILLLQLYIILYLTLHHVLVRKEEGLFEMQEFHLLVIEPFLVNIVVNHQYKDVHLDMIMLKDVNVLSVNSTEDTQLLTFLIFKENQKFMVLIFLRKIKSINLIFAVAVKKELLLLMKMSNKLMVPVGKDFYYFY